jgi:hypothetical protein
MFKNSCFRPPHPGTKNPLRAGTFTYPLDAGERDYRKIPMSRKLFFFKHAIFFRSSRGTVTNRDSRRGLQANFSKKIPQQQP